ncbi:hypothetical protein ACQ7B2_01155, partial [Escherichia coli]
VLAIGGGTKASAPFHVDPTGYVNVTGGATLRGVIDVTGSGTALWTGSGGTIRNFDWQGGGNRMVCVNNSGDLYVGTATSC